MFLYSKDEPITAEVVEDFINQHQAKITDYERLEALYTNDAPIFHEEDKEAYKPDNRIGVPFPKYMVDTFNGFFTGVPIKIGHKEDKELDGTIDEFERLNDMDDMTSEISKLTDIHGHAYAYVFQNEEAQTRVVKVHPRNAFVVYANTIEQEPLFGVYYTTQDDGSIEGHVHTKNESAEYLKVSYESILTDWQPHYYGEVPIVEFVQNEERISLIETTESLINAYDKALSEKANDVDYFADAYLAVLGAELGEDGVHRIRDNRLINVFGTDNADKIVVEFLEKPNADTTQENLLDRLERLIYQTSMIVNLNDENFGSASGISLEMKLQPMQNLAKTKERKFKTSLNKIFKMFFALPTNVPTNKRDEYLNINYTFTQNLPRNHKEEAETARALEGIVSRETQLKGLSQVDNVQDELDRIEEEYAPLPQHDFERAVEDELNPVDEMSEEVWPE